MTIALSNVVEIERLLREQSRTGNFTPTTVIRELRSAGFEAGRYYELTHEGKNDRPVLVPRHIDIQGLDVAQERDRLTVEFHESNLAHIEEDADYLHISGKAPSQEGVSKNIPEIQRSVDGRESIYFPLKMDDRIVAEYCFVAPANSSISSRDLEAVCLLARIASNYFAIAHEARVSKVTRRIREEVLARNGGVDFDGLYSKLCDYLLKGLNADSVSIFESTRFTGKLSKKYEALQAGLERNQTPSESYEPGENITGRAFHNGEHAYRVNLSRSENRASVNSVCEKYYSQHFGPLREIIYKKIVCYDRIILVRVINKSCKRGVDTFCDSDISFVDRIVEYIRPLADLAAKSEWLDYFSSISQDAFTVFDDVDRFLEKIGQRIDGKCVTSAAILHRKVDSEDRCKLGSWPASNRLKEVMLSCNMESLLDLQRRRKQIFTLTLTELSRAKGFSEFADFLRRNGASSIVGHHIANEDIDAIVLFGVSAAAGTPKSRLLDSASTSFVVLTSRLISSVALTSTSHMNITSARRLVGVIGHEVQSQITELTNCGKDRLMDVEDAACEHLTDERIRSSIEDLVTDAQDEIDNQMIGLNAFFSVSQAMAQGSDSTIRVTLDPVDLSEIAHDVVEQLKTEVPYLQPTHATAQCVFDFNEAWRTEAKLCADRYFIRIIFENIMRNALKFSVPPGGGRPIRIGLHLNPQSECLNVLVENWGTGIPANEFETIFEPFRRGSWNDPVVSRRGMGAGLNISRRFARAHGGTVICRSSIREFDDPSRPTEGFRNVFEIRLARGLLPGTKEVRVG